MLTFFHGWRRKTGVVTLVMLVFVMDCWLKLDSDRKVFAIPFFDLRTHYFASDRGRFVWVAIQGRKWLPSDLLKWATDDFRVDCSPDYPFLLCDRRPFNWPRGEQKPVPMMISMTAMPYWSIIIPLSLLSAFLLPTKSDFRPIVWPPIKFWLKALATFVFAIFAIVVYSLPTVQQ